MLRARFDEPVWGDGVYTDDSSIGGAAVHAGLLQPGQTDGVELRYQTRTRKRKA